MCRCWLKISKFQIDNLQHLHRLQSSARLAETQQSHTRRPLALRNSVFCEIQKVGRLCCSRSGYRLSSPQAFSWAVWSAPLHHHPPGGVFARASIASSLVSFVVFMTTVTLGRRSPPSADGNSSPTSFLSRLATNGPQNSQRRSFAPSSLSICPSSPSFTLRLFFVLARSSQSTPTRFLKNLRNMSQAKSNVLPGGASIWTCRWPGRV